MMKFYFIVILIFCNFFSQAQLVQSEEQAKAENEIFDEWYFEAIPTDRPGFTMNANTLFKNSWMIQAGVGTGNLVNYQNSDEFNTFHFPFNLRYGITNRLEAMFTTDLYFAGRTQYGSSDVEYGLQRYGLGARYNVFSYGLHGAPKGKNIGSLALFAEYNYLRYESGIEKRNNLITKALYTIQPLNWLKISANAGFVYVLSDEEQTLSDRLVYTINLAFPITQRVSVFIENYGEQGSLNGFNLGGSFWSSPNFQWDIFVGRGLLGEYEQYFGQIGFSYRMGKHYRQ